MAITVPVSPYFAAGATVKAYPATNWPATQRPPAAGSTQVGSSAESATVAADGTVTFSALTEDVEYFLTVDGSGKYVRLVPDASANRAEGGQPGTAAGNIRKTVTTAGTRVALSTSTLRVRRAVVCALATNTGIVVVGGSSVVAAVGTRNSPFLNAGDTIELGPVDLAATYIDSTVNGEGVTVYYEA